MKTKIISVLILPFVFQIVSAQTWQWAKHFGSVQNVPVDLYESVNGIGLDSSGNVFVAGKVMQLAEMDDSLITTSHGQYFQGFLAKYDCAGNRKWIRLMLSNHQGDKVTGLAVDEIGNCYVTGFAASTTVYFGSNTYTFGNYAGWFLAKYDSSGAFQWVTFSQIFPAAHEARGPAIAINSQGQIIVSGHLFNNQPGIVFPGVTLRNGNFIAAFNPNTGSAIWGINVDTASYSSQFSLLTLAMDNADNIYVGGWFNDTVRIGSQIFTAHPLGGHALLVKYNPIGTLQWAIQRPYNPSFLSSIKALTCVGNTIYVYASVMRNDTLFNYPVTFSGAPVQSYVVLQLDGSGNLISGITRDSMTAVYGNTYQSLINDADGNIYLTDAFRGKLKWGTYPSINANAGTNGSPYILKLSSSLQVQSLVRVPGTGGIYDGGQAIAVNDDGDVYLGGAVSRSIIVGNDTVNNIGSTTTDNDLFLLKYGGTCPLPTVIDENYFLSSTSIFPNPSSGKFVVEANGMLSVYDMLGEKVFEKKFVSEKTEIDLSNHPNGVYFVQLRNNEQTITRKILLSK